jgi:high-affinity nickel permease
MESRAVAKTESANLTNPVRCSSCSELPASATAKIVILFTAGMSLVSTIDGPRKKY